MINKRPCDDCRWERPGGGCINYTHCARWREWFGVEWRRATAHTKEYLKERRRKK